MRTRACGCGNRPARRSGQERLLMDCLHYPEERVQSITKTPPPLDRRAVAPCLPVTVHRRSTMTTYKVGYFVGSLAKGSINRKMSKALVRLAPEGLELSEIPFGNLPLYNSDYD